MRVILASSLNSRYTPPTPASHRINLTLWLQFVQTLSNPFYVAFLAEQKLLNKPEFVAYLDYLQYWTKPEFARFLAYPGPTLRMLELLQQKRFRDDILNPSVMMQLFDEGVGSSVLRNQST